MHAKMAVFLSFFPRKTETFIHNELTELQKKGIELQVLALIRVSDQWVKKPILKNVVTNYFIPMGYWIWIRGFIYALREPKVLFKQLRWILSLKHKNFLLCLRVMSALLVAYGIRNHILKEKFNYLHAHFASYPTEIVMCLSRLTGIPYGATWHAFDIWKDGNILPEKIHYAQQIMTCTQYNLEYLKTLVNHSDSTKLQRVYHGVDFSYLPKAIPLQPGNPLLAVGRLIPKKGFCYLVDALGLLKTKGHILSLNIIGFQRPFIDRITSGEGSELKRLQSKIKHYGLESQVTLIGYLPHSEVLTMMSQCSALIMPSVRDKHNNIDGIPNVILEAMAMQRPVIASRISGIPEVIIDGETGLLVESGDVAGLAEAILRVATDSALAKNLGQHAHDFVFSYFDLDKNMAECLHCFAEQHS